MRRMAFAVAVAFLIVGGGATAVAQDDVKELESNCDAGNLDACVKVGRMLEFGIDIPKDNARAVSLYQKACDGGSSIGCYRLAECYRSPGSGRGVQTDLTRAASLAEKACEGQYAAGCVMLGRAYMRGEGVPQDYTLAFSVLEQACNNLESITACEVGAKLNSPARGDLKDATRWAMFMKQTCHLSLSEYPAGHREAGDACLALGIAYDLGMWVPKNTDHATVLFKKGCFVKNKTACDLINR